LEAATLAKSANHKCVDIANAYMYSAVYLKTVSHVQIKDLNFVKKWRPVLHRSLSSAIRMKTDNILLACSIVELAIWFIINHLQDLPIHTIAASPKISCDKSVKFVSPSQAKGKSFKLSVTMPSAVNTELTFCQWLYC
jgi:hypothetical protein